MAFEGDLAKVLKDLPESTAGVTRDALGDCLQACYDAKKGSLCADECYSKYGLVAEHREKIQALFTKYSGTI